NDFDDPDLADISAGEKRILLTRDRELLKRSKVSHGYYVRHTNPRKQFKEILQRFDLRSAIRPFQRCPVCNASLEKVNLEDIREKLPNTTAQIFREFRECPGCGRVYWKGSHYQALKSFIDQIESEINSPEEINQM
ncbi:Mut7-C RNAse domain-containing protein, partial [bacterium]|nr:Mut7-C RNAse domain-containing protein [candidate division CSSED10-310 bacterium]